MAMKASFWVKLEISGFFAKSKILLTIWITLSSSQMNMNVSPLRYLSATKLTKDPALPYEVVFIADSFHRLKNKNCQTGKMESAGFEPATSSFLFCLAGRFLAFGKSACERCVQASKKALCCALPLSYDPCDS